MPFCVTFVGVYAHGSSKTNLKLRKKHSFSGYAQDSNLSQRMFWESILFFLCFYNSFLGIPCWPSSQAGCSPGWTFADPAQLFYVSVEYLLWKTCTALWILQVSSYLREAQVLPHLAVLTRSACHVMNAFLTLFNSAELRECGSGSSSNVRISLITHQAVSGNKLRMWHALWK